ncbi:DUF862-domain-containing protein [Backusella circina FSU 941]|nr:DUF862-domain-containing protein [Backusella circina FSU 941]
MAEVVKLYVYDLSQGMAKTMSRSLTGKQIDGIWHTSVVVYGQEFYFGQGIMNSMPGQTMHGRPLEMIDMGETFLPLEVFVEYLDSQRSIYTAEKYHLLDFNCNTFSNDVCQFLTGKGIPGHITDLPAEFMNTPFGQSILPMIEGMFGRSVLNNGTSQPQQQPTAESISMLQNMSSAAASSSSAAPSKANPVQIVSNVGQLDQFFQQYKAVVVFFTSATCPPCQMIKPDFQKLITDKNEGYQQIRILGVIADVGKAYDIGSKYMIRSTPTFQLFLNGQKYSEFKGANYAELKSQVDILLFEAFPPHPHRKIHLRAILDQPNVPVLYKSVGKLDMIYGKLQGFLDQNNIILDETQKNTLNQAKQVLLDNKQHIDMNQWASLIDLLLDKMPVDQLFPILDIYRTLLVHTEALDYYTHNPSQLVNIIELGYKSNELPKATWLMILRIACNVFANETLSATHFTSNLPTSHRTQLSQLLITSLLAQDSAVRQTAASLAYNCSVSIALERLKKDENEGVLMGMPEQEDDDWEVELSSAILDALTKEKDEEIGKKMERKMMKK